MLLTKLTAAIPLLLRLAIAQCTTNPMPSPSPLPSSLSSLPPVRTVSGPAASNTAGLDYQDFSIVQQQTGAKLYYRFSKSNVTGQGIQVATAPAMAGPWSYAYQALPGALNNSLNTGPSGKNNRPYINLWAPEAHYINGMYYLFYTIFTNGSASQAFVFDLCVATSSNLQANSWIDHGSMGLPLDTSTPLRYVRLDGSLLAADTDPSGAVSATPYMAFGSYNGGLYGMQLTDDYLRIRPGSTISELVADQPNPYPYYYLNENCTMRTYYPNRTEGALLLQHKNYNYLFYSIGNCCPNLSAQWTGYTDSVYRVQVCRTASSTPAGPYVDRDGKSCGSDIGRPGTYILASHRKLSLFRSIFFREISGLLVCAWM